MSIWNSNDKFKNKYRIPSARAKWHNYNDGCFFITFCTKNRMPYFGRITCQQMHYTIIGKYAHECVNRIMELHPDVTVSSWQIMPDHIHLLVIVRKSEHANTVPEIYQNKPVSHANIAKHCGRLSHIIGQYKTAVVRYARKQGLSFAWQERFYDRIIHNESEYANVKAYIENNVRSWKST